MAVIRNPILFVLFALMAGGAFLVVQAGLLGPILKIGNAVVEQGIEIARVMQCFGKVLIVGFIEEFCSSTGEERVEPACLFRGRDGCYG